LLLLLAANKVASHCLESCVLGIELLVVDFTFIRKVSSAFSGAIAIEQLCDANIKDPTFFSPTFLSLSLSLSLSQEFFASAKTRIRDVGVSIKTCGEVSLERRKTEREIAHVSSS